MRVVRVCFLQTNMELPLNFRESSRVPVWHRSPNSRMDQANPTGQKNKIMISQFPFSAKTPEHPGLNESQQVTPSQSHNNMC